MTLMKNTDALCDFIKQKNSYEQNNIADAKQLKPYITYEMIDRLAFASNIALEPYINKKLLQSIQVALNTHDDNKSGHVFKMLETIQSKNAKNKMSLIYDKADIDILNTNALPLNYREVLERIENPLNQEMR